MNLGFRPAPGYFGGFFDNSDDLAQTIEAAKQHAAKQAQLGLTEVMIAQHLSPQRIARPAVGADFDADRLSLVIENLVTVAQIIREKSRFEVSDYRQATGKNHVWTELGRGDVDLVGVLKALPDAFEGWLVVEVDVPDLGTPAESTHASARWIRTQPLLQGGLV
jgi:hypothetical protein